MELSIVFCTNLLYTLSFLLYTTNSYTRCFNDVIQKLLISDLPCTLHGFMTKCGTTWYYYIEQRSPTHEPGPTCGSREMWYWVADLGRCQGLRVKYFNWNQHWKFYIILYRLIYTLYVVYTYIFLLSSYLCMCLYFIPVY